MSGVWVHVVAGAVIGADDRVLIAQRPFGKHLAGGWEFPGGKLNGGEDRRQGLGRELREEIGIQVLECRPLIRLRHTYSDLLVLLDVWLIERFAGVPTGLDGQQLRWCRRDELIDAQLLAADRAVVTALRLPGVIVSCTGPGYRLVPLQRFERGAAHGDAAQLTGVLCESVEEALRAAGAGADFIAMQREMPAAELAECCERVGRPVFACGVGLPEGSQAGAAGIIELTGSDRKSV